MFKTNRLYGLATAFIAITAGMSLVLSTLLLIGQPVDTQQIAGLTEASMPASIVPLNYSFIISSMVAFILAWIATVLVLHHYSKRVGKIKYWIIVSISLVYFLTQFQPLFLSLLSSYSLAQPFTFATIYIIIFSASKPGGGILFVAAFWSIAKKISSKQVRDYIISSAYGACANIWFRAGHYPSQEAVPAIWLSYNILVRTVFVFSFGWHLFFSDLPF